MTLNLLTSIERIISELDVVTLLSHVNSLKPSNIFHFDSSALNFISIEPTDAEIEEFLSDLNSPSLTEITASNVTSIKISLMFHDADMLSKLFFSKPTDSSLDFYSLLAQLFHHLNDLSPISLPFSLEPFSLNLFDSLTCHDVEHLFSIWSRILMLLSSDLFSLSLDPLFVFSFLNYVIQSFFVFCHFIVTNFHFYSSQSLLSSRLLSLLEDIPNPLPMISSFLASFQLESALSSLTSDSDWDIDSPQIELIDPRVRGGSLGGLVIRDDSEDEEGTFIQALDCISLSLQNLPNFPAKFSKEIDNYSLLENLVCNIDFSFNNFSNFLSNLMFNPEIELSDLLLLITFNGQARDQVKFNQKFNQKSLIGTLIDVIFSEVTHETFTKVTNNSDFEPLVKSFLVSVLARRISHPEKCCLSLLPQSSGSLWVDPVGLEGVVFDWINSHSIKFDCGGNFINLFFYLYVSIVSKSIDSNQLFDRVLQFLTVLSSSSQVVLNSFGLVFLIGFSIENLSNFDWSRNLLKFLIERLTTKVDEIPEFLIKILIDSCNQLISLKEFSFPCEIISVICNLDPGFRFYNSFNSFYSNLLSNLIFNHQGDSLKILYQILSFSCNFGLKFLTRFHCLTRSSNPIIEGKISKMICNISPKSFPDILFLFNYLGSEVCLNFFQIISSNISNPEQHVLFLSKLNFLNKNFIESLHLVRNFLFKKVRPSTTVHLVKILNHFLRNSKTFVEPIKLTSEIEFSSKLFLFDTIMSSLSTIHVSSRHHFDGCLLRIRSGFDLIYSFLFKEVPNQIIAKLNHFDIPFIEKCLDLSSKLGSPLVYCEILLKSSVLLFLKGFIDGCNKVFNLFLDNFKQFFYVNFYPVPLLAKFPEKFVENFKLLVEDAVLSSILILSGQNRPFDDVAFIFNSICLFSLTNNSLSEFSLFSVSNNLWVRLIKSTITTDERLKSKFLNEYLDILAKIRSRPLTSYESLTQIFSNDLSLLDSIVCDNNFVQNFPKLIDTTFVLFINNFLIFTDLNSGKFLIKPCSWFFTDNDNLEFLKSCFSVRFNLNQKRKLIDNVSISKFSFLNFYFQNSTIVIQKQLLLFPFEKYFNFTRVFCIKTADFSRPSFLFDRFVFIEPTGTTSSSFISNVNQIDRFLESFELSTFNFDPSRDLPGPHFFSLLSRPGKKCGTNFSPRGKIVTNNLTSLLNLCQNSDEKFIFIVPTIDLLQNSHLFYLYFNYNITFLILPTQKSVPCTKFLLKYLRTSNNVCEIVRRVGIKLDVVISVVS
ncbi:hypothetical protein RCL1_006746 [Eukaryota sp. TZLM3-RCL]